MYYLSKALVFIACLAALITATILELPNGLLGFLVVVFCLQHLFIRPVGTDRRAVRKPSNQQPATTN